MLRGARLLLFAFCTMFVWLFAKPALASGPLCDEIGASSVAPSPFLIESQSFIGANLDGIEVTESGEGMVLVQAPTALCIDDDGSMPGIVAEQPSFTGSVRMVGPSFRDERGEPRSGIQTRLERPPRMFGQ